MEFASPEVKPILAYHPLQNIKSQDRFQEHIISITRYPAQQSFWYQICLNVRRNRSYFSMVLMSPEKRVTSSCDLQIKGKSQDSIL